MKEEKTPWNPSRKATARVKEPILPWEECVYCESPVEIAHHKDVYGKAYSEWPWVYRCTNPRCEAMVGMHPFTNLPLGTLATKPMRDARMWAKKPFTHYWKVCLKGARAEGYRHLAEEMGIDQSLCHFGMFDEEQCRQAKAAADRLIRRFNGDES